MDKEPIGRNRRKSAVVKTKAISPAATARIMCSRHVSPSYRYAEPEPRAPLPEVQISPWSPSRSPKSPLLQIARHPRCSEDLRGPSQKISITYSVQSAPIGQDRLEEAGVELYRELLALVKDKSVVLEEYATRLVSAEAVHLREMELMAMQRPPD